MPTYRRADLKTRLNTITNRIAELRNKTVTPNEKQELQSLYKQLTKIDYILKRNPNDDSPNSGTITIPNSELIPNVIPAQIKDKQEEEN